MKYHLDSMLPIRAFNPRSGRARGFAAGGMTLEGDSGSSNSWWNDYNAGAVSPEIQQGLCDLAEAGRISPLPLEGCEGDPLLCHSDDVLPRHHVRGQHLHLDHQEG